MRKVFNSARLPLTLNRRFLQNFIVTYGCSTRQSLKQEPKYPPGVCHPGTPVPAMFAWRTPPPRNPRSPSPRPCTGRGRLCSSLACIPVFQAIWPVRPVHGFSQSDFGMAAGQPECAAFTTKEPRDVRALSPRCGAYESTGRHFGHIFLITNDLMASTYAPSLTYGYASRAVLYPASVHIRQILWYGE